MEESVEDIKGNSAQRSRKREEMNKNENLMETSYKRGRNPKKPKINR